MSENLCSNEMKPFILGSDVNEYGDHDDDEEHCQPPTTFSVETVSPIDQKLNWLIFASGLSYNANNPSDYPGNPFHPSSYPGNPFNPIGATVICGLCHLRRRVFYCEGCIRKGEFGHSNLRRPECMSEKRLNELELERKKENLKIEIQNRTNARQKVLLLNEQIKSCKQRSKHLKYLVDSEKTKLAKNLENKAKLSSVNIRRKQRLPLFADKVRKICEYLRKFEENLDNEKSSTGHKLKILAGTRRKYADDLGRYIFPIFLEANNEDNNGVTVNRCSINIVDDMCEAMGSSQEHHQISFSSEQSDFSSQISLYEATTATPESQDRYFTEISEEIIDAMGTSYIRGRWVTATHSRAFDVRLYRIVSAVISATDESPAFPALTDRETEFARTCENHTIAAGLSFCAQLTSLLAACFDTLLPKRMSFADFGIPCKTEYKFYKLIARLNLNIVHLCLVQGVDPLELRPRQFLHNLFILFQHIKKDDLTTLGLTNRPVAQTDTLFSMSQAICTDLEILSEDLTNQDSEEESENDEFRDWEAVAGNSGIPWTESFPIFHTTSTASMQQYSGITTASTFVTSLFRNFTGTNQ